MELYIYNKELVLQGVIDEITSFLWIRRFFRTGEFKLLVPFTEQNSQLLRKENIIVRKGETEAAQISYAGIRRNIQGLEEIEVQGCFLTHWIARRVVANQIIKTSTAKDLIETMLYENMIMPTDYDRTINVSMHPFNNYITGDSFEYISEPYVNMEIAIEALARMAKLGFRIETDIKTKTHSFLIYKGRNLTAGQTMNHQCIFSKEFDNVIEQEYTNSVENLKNVAYVIGEEAVAEIGIGSGLERNEIAFSATDITRRYEVNGQERFWSESEYVELLRQRGNKEIEQYSESLNFSSKINALSNLRYKEDYDLGDVVTCVDKNWNIQIDVRITEIVESYQRAKQEIEITFGEALPTLYDKLKMR